jgi:hypothetical protein
LLLSWLSGSYPNLGKFRGAIVAHCAQNTLEKSAVEICDCVNVIDASITLWSVQTVGTLSYDKCDFVNCDCIVIVANVHCGTF